jgi:hypothetical protein
MSPDPGRRFTVSWNGSGLDRVRRLSEKARELGVGPDWVTTLRRIEYQLQTDPGTGDPLYPLRGLGLMVHRSIVDRVEAVYAVHDTQPIVFVIRLTPRFDHPLEGVE